MATGDTTQQSPPPVFNKYRDFLEQVSDDPAGEYPALCHRLQQLDRSRHELWLLRVPKDGTAIHTYRVEEPNNVKPQDYERINVRNLRAMIASGDEEMEYQAVLLANYSKKISAWIVDNLAIGLDMEPYVWEHLLGKVASREFHDLPAQLNRDHFVEIGSNFMVLMDRVAGGRPKTALIILDEHPVARKPVINPSPRPSVMVRPTREPIWGGKGKEGYLTYIIRRHITLDTEPDKFGSGNSLFRCLDGFLSVHFELSATNIPNPSFLDFESILYDRVWANTTPQETWYQMRLKLDECRTILLRLELQMKLNFTVVEGGELEKQYQRLKQKLEIDLRDLEAVEARLRDYIDVLGSKKSTEMAERSIAESKRVMLLTSLAFVFVPVSLASSIYGMVSELKYKILYLP
ncbi:hypothetical protein BDV95DRAFT_565823 [Massariosphaeria phaeospora]|uniref:Uncharacterized protein n=1 Tax=Massariosphaeria phaeospora TaxID=100035 RepID=A0A7C8IDE1_9PLEO|nr:hypothetical protein BDV95DRAFT_565823 [Massariosphaeria phaeospora]